MFDGSFCLCSGNSGIKDECEYETVVQLIEVIYRKSCSSLHYVSHRDWPAMNPEPN